VKSEIQKAQREARLTGISLEGVEGEEKYEYVRAAEDVWILPDASKKVRLDGDFSGKEGWLVERLTVNMKEGFYGSGAPSLDPKTPSYTSQTYRHPDNESAGEMS
jgi:hypothetical protein